MHKFRRMGVNGEKRQPEVEFRDEVSGLVIKIQTVQRITRIGDFLRKTGIDDLPQLFNELKKAE
jgi:lipopolysaccharide/colanic/teichoic acid biosynthesis glycosyltransferase